MTRRQQESFAQFLQTARTRLRARIAGVIARPQDLTQDSDAIHRLAAWTFRELLADPVGPESRTYMPLNAGHPGTTSGLVAVGVHSAGEYMPEGRQSMIFVSDAALRRSRKAAGRTARGRDPACFLKLFNALYRGIFGRQLTLIHSLLHNAASGAVVELGLEVRGNTRGTISVLPVAGQVRGRAPLRLGQAFSYLADKDVLRRFVNFLWEKTPETADLRRADWQKDEYVSLQAEQLIRLLRDGRDPTELGAGCCFLHTFEKNTHRAADALESQGVARDLLEVVFGSGYPARGDHEVAELTERAVVMLQLFLLYREICGDWFYVIVPGRQDKLSMCFTIGTRSRLDPERRRSLVELASAVYQEVKDGLTARHDHPTRGERSFSAAGDYAILEKLLRGQTIQALEVKIPGLKDGQSRVAGGLASYLVFSERVSEVAVHEGKKLHFDVLVADGLFASEMLARASKLSSVGGGTWRVADMPQAGPRKGSLVANEELISRLIGNYSFMQQRGVVLYGTREAKLLYLARLLESGLDPEKLTQTGKCYLLRVRSNGDTCVFFKGELVLWRRNGEYIVPTMYGEAYISKLKDKLQEWFPQPATGPGVAYRVLARAVWELSNKRESGACFVLARRESRAFCVNRSTYEMSEVFPYAEGLPLVQEGSAERLKQLAVQDGAILVDVATGKVFGRRQLLPPKRFDWRGLRKQWTGGDEGKAWEQWYKVLRWGTRHHSALAFSSAAGPNAVVITVSRDGDIHVLRGNRPERDLTYPRQAEG